MPCMQHPAVLENLNPCSRCLKAFCQDCLDELKGNRFCALVDYLPACFRKDKCTLHDLAARTRVIKVN